MSRKKKTVGSVAESTLETTQDQLLVGLYLRLSVEDGDDMEKSSIRNQREICQKKASELQNAHVVDCYVDYGCTGMNYSRPDFIRLINDVENGNVNCIIVKDISRFGRHYVYTAEYVERYLPEHHVRLICVNDNYDSADEDAKTSELLMPFLMVINDSYARDISRKIRSSISAKMAAGEFLPAAGSVPYGYLRDPDRITFRIDHETADVVRHIFELRAERLPYNAIANALNETGIPSPARIRFLRGQTESSKSEVAIWARKTIRKIVTDTVYIGWRTHGKIKRESLGGKKCMRPKDEWQVIQDAHPPIVDPELFEKVQKVNALEKERISAYQKHAAPLKDYRSVLADKVYCGDCKGKMVACLRHQREGSSLPTAISYQCNTYLHFHMQECSNHYITETVIVDALLLTVNRHIEATMNRIEMQPARKKEQTADALHGIRIKINRVEKQIENLLPDHLEGLLNREEFLYAKKRLESQRSGLLEQLNSIAEECRRTDAAQKEREVFLETIMKFKRMKKLDREIVELLVERIEVYEGRRIEIFLRYQNPFVCLTDKLSAFEGENRHEAV